MMAIVAVMGARRCGGSARYGAHAPTNRRTDTSTTAAPRDRTDYSPGAGADQPSPQCSLCGIVGVGERGGRQHQPGADYAGDSRLLSHFSTPDPTERTTSAGCSSDSGPKRSCLGIDTPRWGAISEVASGNSEGFRSVSTMRLSTWMEVPK